MNKPAKFSGTVESDIAVSNEWKELNRQIINSKDQDGFTALFKASEQGRMPEVKYLIENGAKMNVTDNCGHTALHMAAVNKHSDVVKYLMDQAKLGSPFGETLDQASKVEK